MRYRIESTSTPGKVLGHILTNDEGKITSQIPLNPAKVRTGRKSYGHALSLWTIGGDVNERARAQLSRQTMLRDQSANS